MPIGSATQGKRRSIGVVDIPNGALGGGRIRDNAPHLHPFSVGFDKLIVTAVDDGGMTKSAQIQHFGGGRKALLGIIHNKIGQYRREFFL